ncbi:hypothetical protein ACL58G_01455 [Massilia sp. GER05]|uniref:ORC-CDC6 family AAA ATPase n=1 Tax=Massilia sp. GER05 TaxID=3394605 RepID=UPI003F824AEF
MTTASFLAAFNAKAMSYDQVASSFVPSPKFHEFAGQWNSLLIGPRGSGKTTLLRMLSLEGMRAWPGKEADEFRNALNYTGIYVPADIAWGEMINSMKNGMTDASFGMLAEAAFVTNVLSATIAAMSLRLQPVKQNTGKEGYRSVEVSQNVVQDLVVQIARLWQLEVRSATLLSIQNALGERSLQIAQNANLMGRGTLSREQLINSMPYIGLPLIESVNQAIIAFDRAADQSDGIWVLLLDEFEVAPSYLQTMVLTALRAGKTKLLFKVALAPCGPHTLLPLETSTPPTGKDDFRQVELWYADKGVAEGFCEKVFMSRTSNDLRLAGSKPERIFGKSAYAIVDEEGRESNATPVGQKSEQYAKEFLALAERDHSFAEFLRRKEIKLPHLNVSDSAPNGTVIRKIAPIVAFRNAYRGAREGKKRGRKAFASAYSGWSAIAAISEGNPRWLIGMLSAIFANVESGIKLPLPVPVQHRHVTDTGWTFANVLRTAAIQQFDQIQTSQPIFELLTRIGNYFFDRLVTDDFKEDPPLSFTVDAKIDEDTINCLRIALNHGAIVCYEPADGIGGFGNLRGKRFRLSYLLSPCYKLPVRKSKNVSLSTILESKAALELGQKANIDRKPRSKSEKVTPTAQGSLF